MSFIINKPYPIKICYLKDESKPPEVEREQKISVTFLSSIIQQEKNSKKENEEQLNQPYYANSEKTENMEDRNYLTPFTQQKRRSQTFDKWRNRKTKSQAQDKRLLTNLIGADWLEKSNKADSSSKINRKNKMMNNRFDHFEQQQRKKNSKKLMENHFYTFLSNKKQDDHCLQAVDDINSNCFVSKLDERAFQSLKPLNIISRLKNSIKERQIYKINKGQQLHTFDSHLKNNGKRSNSIMGGTTRKKGFSEMPNFKWSKLGNSQKFRLNDHS